METEFHNSFFSMSMSQQFNNIGHQVRQARSPAKSFGLKH